MASTPLSMRPLLVRDTAYPGPFVLFPIKNQRKRGQVNCSLSPSPPNRSSRRSASIALLLLHHFSALPDRADAGSPFDKYVKRKKLEPLEAYVPAVILTQAQFKALERTFNLEQPKYDVAQYATDDGKGKTASEAVDRCLSALEELDSLFLRASRNDPTASIESMKGKITVALSALDSLLQTVPTAVLDKGKAIADAYMMPSDQNEESKPEDLDPDLKQLEALL